MTAKKLVGLSSYGYNPMHTYHISFLGKKAISHTFRAHPLQWKPYSGVLFLSEVSTSIHTFRKSKVSNFYDKVNVNPANEKKLVILKWDVCA